MDNTLVYATRELATRLASMAIETGKLRAENEKLKQTNQQLGQANQLLKKQLKEGDGKNAAKANTDDKQTKHK